MHAKQVYGLPDLSKMQGVAFVVSVAANNSTQTPTGFGIGKLQMGDGESDPIDFSGSFTGFDLSADYFVGGSKLVDSNPDGMTCN